MTSYSENISNIVDAVIARLNDNLDAINNPVVEERVGEVQFPADANVQLPIIYVYPLIDGDSISLTIDDEASLHEFSIALDCFYWNEHNDNTDEAVRLSRNMMLDIAELFKARGGHLTMQSYVTDIMCDYTKYAVSGNIIDSYAIELAVTSYN